MTTVTDTPNVDPNVEIRLNEDGTLDELVGRGADAHLEQMSGKGWWLIIGNVAVYLGSTKKIRATYEVRGPE